MRSDTVLVLDIVDAARQVALFIEGMSLEEFRADLKSQAAVKHQILVMGEAAKKVSQEFKEANLSVPWADLIQLRNFYIHVYHAIDLNRLWRTVNGLIVDVEEKLSSHTAVDEDTT